MEFDLNEDPDPLDIDWGSSDQICISNTMFAFLFTMFSFSSACCIIVACQILNYYEKEVKKQMLSDPEKKIKNSGAFSIEMNIIELMSGMNQNKENAFFGIITIQFSHSCIKG